MVKKTNPTGKLKPVILVRNHHNSGLRNRQNTSQQIMLLKALQVTSDPKKLKEMIGVRTVAEVYRTLDKMAIRKEFHRALDRAGISFDFIVGGIQRIASTAEKDSDRLKAFDILLKTLGLDKYEDTGTGGGSWEETMLKALEAKNEVKELPPAPNEDYVVKPPVIPESVKKQQQKEDETMNTLYGSRTGTNTQRSE